MGRTKYSEEKRNEIVSSFVKATIEIMKEDGVEAVSIRSVSARAGYSSATLYLYFTDLNELISIASVFYLRNYVRDISETCPSYECSAEELYRYTWETFARHALNKPEIYLNLFFGPNSGSLQEMVHEYYALFPEELENIRRGPVLGMLEAGNLHDRNRAVLAPYAEEIGMPEGEMEMANNITVAFFRSILERACKMDLDESTKKHLVGEFLQGAFFILRT